MRCAGDRWSLMLQLTSNLASAIIKPSLLDVSLCSHRTPSAQTQKSHFVSQGSEMRLCLGVCFGVSACVWVDDRESAGERVCAIVKALTMFLFYFIFYGLCIFPLIQSKLSGNESEWLCLTTSTFWLFSQKYVCWSSGWFLSVLFLNWTKSRPYSISLLLSLSFYPPSFCHIPQSLHLSSPFSYFCSPYLSCSFVITNCRSVWQNLPLCSQHDQDTCTHWVGIHQGTVSPAWRLLWDNYTEIHTGCVIRQCHRVLCVHSCVCVCVWYGAFVRIRGLYVVFLC